MLFCGNKHIIIIHNNFIDNLSVHIFGANCINYYITQLICIVLSFLYSGDINKDEMTALKDKYDKEIEKINAILRKQQNNQTAIQERQNNTDELRNIIINEVCSENVYGEIVDKIIVYDDYMLVKLKYIDFAFKIKYSTHGYMEKYTTVVESCEIVSF